MLLFCSLSKLQRFPHHLSYPVSIQRWNTQKKLSFMCFFLQSNFWYHHHHQKNNDNKHNSNKISKIGQPCFFILLVLIYLILIFQNHSWNWEMRSWERKFLVMECYIKSGGNCIIVTRRNLTTVHISFLNTCLKFISLKGNLVSFRESHSDQVYKKSVKK